MKILGVDTSTKFLCIGIYNEKTGVSEFRIDLGRKHSSYILPTIKRMLNSLDIKPEDLDYFAVGLGPGSFTGIRIGLSVIKGLVYCLNKPLIGISSLDILALNAQEALYSNYRLKEINPVRKDFSWGAKLSNGVKICPVIDAKRKLIFSTLYTMKDSYLRRAMPYKLISVDGLVKRIPAQTIFLGDALKLYKERIRHKAKRAILLDEDYWYPWPRNIIELAKERIRTKKIDDLRTIKPLYLYPKECQVRRFSQI